MQDLNTLSINAIRVLSADQVQKANSGHPGLPLGCAAIGYELWGNQMNHNPKNPNWKNRDRFILSGGHGSSMLYSLLHLFGYGLEIEDLKNFRQKGSKTPGHPEYGHTVGVEATTGPLGAGMAQAVGMAIAEAHLGATFNTEEYKIVDHYTYVLGGDGCMMEGISYEAFSLAGTLGLDKLIVIYDSNKITIEGNTDIAFTENVLERMSSCGFQTLVVEDGNDINALGNAIKKAKSEKNRPSFIMVKTQIGYGCPQKQGKASAHGEPLGVDNIKEMKEFLNYPSLEEFHVPQEVYEHYKTLAQKGIDAEEKWNKQFEEYTKKYPDLASKWEAYHKEIDAESLYNNEEFWSYEDKPDATRNLSGIVLNRLKELVPNLIGGSADLAPSNKTYMSGEGDFSKENYKGRNMHFGVRELAMAAIVNGMALHGGLKAFGATFFVFSDYTKPMLRLASLMNLPTTMVFTHDSIGVGEDGPTHEPVEQYAMLRSMPNYHLFRPADATETIAAWYYAITSKKTPVGLALTRQNLPQYKGSSKEALKGAYIISPSEKETPEAIIIATGSEIEIAIKAQEELKKENIDVQVVSMPCMTLFEEQTEEYKESILPKAIRKRVAVEAGTNYGWERYVGIDGKIISMKSFGASAPANILFKEFGFTTENVVKNVKEFF